MMLDAAVSGGPATAEYLGQMVRFADLAAHLDKTGAGAFTVGDGPDANSRQATATDGYSTMHVLVRLNDDLAESPFNGVPVRGVATIRLSQPAPRDIVKIVELGIGLGEIPPTIIVTQALWTALFSPLLSRLTSVVQTAMTKWMETDVGDLDALGEAIEDGAAEAAEAESEEVAELIVEEEVLAEVTIDLAAAVPPLAALGVLLAIPLLIQLLDKTFELHLEIDNLTDHDLRLDAGVPVQRRHDGPAGLAGAAPHGPGHRRLGRQDRGRRDLPGQLLVDEPQRVRGDRVRPADRTHGHEGPGPGRGRLGPVGSRQRRVARGRTSLSDWVALYDEHGTGDGSTAVHHGNQRLYAALGHRCGERPRGRLPRRPAGRAALRRGTGP